MTRTLVDLPLGKVHPHPANQRAGLQDIDQLAASIKAVGLIQPIVVQPHPEKAGEWRIVAGHRRHAAATKAGLKSITAEVRDDLDDRDTLAAMLVENLQRQELTPLEEAAGYRQLLDLGWKQKDIADRTGRSAGVVSKRLKLLDLPDVLLPAVRDGRIRVETGYELARTLADRHVDGPALVTHVLQTLDEFDTDLDRPYVSEEVDTLVQSTARAATSARAADQLRTELTAEGAVELDAPGANRGKPIEGWNGLEVDYDAHRPEPCSRFRIIERHGGTVDPQWWCVEPSRHYPDGVSDVKVTADWWARNDPDAKTSKRETSWDRENRIREARKAFRLDLYKKTVASDPKTWPVTKDLVYQQAIVLTLHQSMHLTGADLQLVCDLLSIGYKSSTRVDTLRDLVGESFARETDRTALAVVLAAGEGWAIDRAEKSPARDFAILLGCEFDDDQLDTGDAA